jgi:LacI family transcriptional regulator
MRRTTLQDIATYVGTSVATVSRVLGGSSYPVREALKKQIRAAAEQLEYLPDQAGRMLKTRRSREIGVIVPTITNPFYARLLLGVELEARKHGYHVLFCDSFRNSETERACIQSLIEKQVAGLVISSINEDPRFLEKAGRQGLQIVAIDQNIDSCLIHRVGFDFFKAGLMASDYLASLGHRNIVLATTPLTRRSRREQLEGFRLGLTRHQIDWTDGRVFIAADEQEQESLIYEFSAGRTLAEQVLNASSRPEAIVAVNDLVAMSLMQHLVAAGLKIPADLSVIGFDNLDFAEMVTPALTTIEQPALEMGRTACQVLLGQIDDAHINPEDEKKASAANISARQSAPVALTLEPRLVVRQSTARAVKQ